jgi:hypothetical protein
VKAQKQVPTQEVARKYVHDNMFEKGGWREAAKGLSHKTLPFLLGLESSLTPTRITALLFRFTLLVAVAIYPIVVRKALVAPSSIPPSHPVSAFGSAWGPLVSALSDPAPVDYVLGALAVALTALPKVFDILGKRTKVAQHSPYYDLSASIQAMPKAEGGSADDADKAIHLALSALREEMSELIGDERKVRVTDVTFLEFCDERGSQLQVRARTAQHEVVKRPVAAEKFVAYYVALEGRGFAEHDFLRQGNPFPANRVTVLGSPSVDYRSVLYMPVICSERQTTDGGTAFKVVDSCIGIICVHSAKPYRFWRWGDHRKGVGGFADIAIDRSMPYIAIIKRLTEQTAHKVSLEVT